MIGDAETHYELESPLRVDLALLDGSSLAIDVDAVVVASTRVDLSGTVDVAAWRPAIVAGAFASDLYEVGDLPDDSAAVRVELTLRSSLLGRFADEDAGFAELFGVSPTPLRSADAWLVMTAMQRLAVPGEDGLFTDVGIRTRWGDDPAAV